MTVEKRMLIDRRKTPFSAEFEYLRYSSTMLETPIRASAIKKVAMTSRHNRFRDRSVLLKMSLKFPPMADNDTS